MAPTGSTLESVRDEIDAMYELRDESLEFTPSDKEYYDELLAMEARLMRWERWFPRTGLRSGELPR